MSPVNRGGNPFVASGPQPPAPLMPGPERSMRPPGLAPSLAPGEAQQPPAPSRPPVERQQISPLGGMAQLQGGGTGNGPAQQVGAGMASAENQNKVFGQNTFAPAVTNQSQGPALGGQTGNYSPPIGATASNPKFFGR